MSDYIKQNGKDCSFTTSENWLITDSVVQKIKYKVESKGTKLKNWNISIYRGILTGLNDAFLIDKRTKDRLIAEDPKSAEIIRPILRGKDIKRYSHSDSKTWLLFVPWHFPLHTQNITGPSQKAENLFREEYPAVYNHLLRYKEQLENRNIQEVGIRYEWYALQRYGSNYWEDFSKPKIIYPRITQSSGFLYDRDGYIGLDSSFFIVGNNIEYLISFLNSSLFHFCFRENFPQLGEKGRDFRKAYIVEIPVMEVSAETNEKFKPLVEEIQNCTSKFERHQASQKIDKLIFDLYNLSDEERKTVLNSVQFDDM